MDKVGQGKLPMYHKYARVHQFVPLSSNTTKFQLGENDVENSVQRFKPSKSGK